MFQVVCMYGDNEPWWFFDGWQEEIIEEQRFSTFEEAEKCYTEKWQQLKEQYTNLQTKPNYLSAFWDQQDERWCDECDDFLQQYMGLALVKDYLPVDKESRKNIYETTNSSGKAKCCKRPQQSIGC